MRKSWVLALSLIFLLAGCAPSFNKEQEIKQDGKSESKEETAIIPKYKISDDYYQTILPFEPSKARGLVVSNLNTRYDIEEFENGLMRMAQTQFDPDEYLFQEGQILDGTTISKWLRREYTKEQLKENKVEAKDNIGLNPVDPGKGDIKERNEKNPIYLAHILEHDYLKKDGDKVSLAGVTIGLALNSVHYYQKEQYGATYEKKIDKKKMEEEGKKIAAEVLKRLRQMDQLKNVPITIALFEQKEKSSVVPGNFISYTNVGENANSIGKWNELDEHYYLFPTSSEAKEKYRDDVTAFTNFKEDVEEFFPNFNGVIGRALYANGEMQSLNIDIPIQFYGNSEAVAFTQYVTGLVMERFPKYIALQVSITSVNGPEALIVREADAGEPQVHIYE
ncbi:CamS family sex pheromone protein [Bacillus massiliglaciei]|uniref:CamS family sex pheromone protein n=1 Tax=Bacillus massiliglaciei TaxID=1816693 RepID=UPI000DA618DC|nr:CamS family sex pheromone protein [Bacillus massiliglaciei]